MPARGSALHRIQSNPTLRGAVAQDFYLANKFDVNQDGELQQDEQHELRKKMVLSPRTPSLFYIENTSVHRKGV